MTSKQIYQYFLNYDTRLKKKNLISHPKRVRRVIMLYRLILLAYFRCRVPMPDLEIDYDL